MVQALIIHIIIRRYMVINERWTVWARVVEVASLHRIYMFQPPLTDYRSPSP